MKKAIVFSLVLALAIGVVTAGILYAHGPGYYGKEEVKVNVKKIKKGIQITIISDDPEIAKDIKKDAKWYEKFFASRDQCPYGSDYRHHRGMMGGQKGMMGGQEGK